MLNSLFRLFYGDSTSNYFEKIPREIKLLIFSKLSGEKRLEISRTNKEWRDLNLKEAKTAIRAQELAKMVNENPQLTKRYFSFNFSFWKKPNKPYKLNIENIFNDSELEPNKILDLAIKDFNLPIKSDEKNKISLLERIARTDREDILNLYLARYQAQQDELLEGAEAALEAEKPNNALLLLQRLDRGSISQLLNDICWDLDEMVNSNIDSWRHFFDILRDKVGEDILMQTFPVSFKIYHSNNPLNL